MNPTLVTLAPALLAAALAGCAAGGAPFDAAAVKAPREYRTGSNLPVRDPAPAPSAADRERAAEEVRALQKTTLPGPPR